jgi:hypothetical protein
MWGNNESFEAATRSTSLVKLEGRIVKRPHLDD